MKSIKIVFLGLLFAVLSGCASFPQNKVPSISVPFSNVATQNSSVNVSFKFYTGHPDKGRIVERPNANSQIRPIIETSLQDTQVFDRIYFDNSQVSDYALDVSIYNHGNFGLAALSGFITGFSLFVIPGTATDNYTVVSKLRDSDGKLLAESRSEDAVRTWLGIWFLPLAGNTPAKALTETIGNQVKAGVKEIAEDSEVNLAKN